MQKKAGLICGCTLVAGAVGLFMRWIQNNSIFDPDTGLHTPGSASSIALTIICVAAAVALFVLVRGLKGCECSPEFRVALRGKSIFYPLAAALLGAAVIIGAIMLFFSAGDTAYPLWSRVLSLLAAAAGVCFPALAMGPKRGSGGGLMCAATLIPVALFCYWIMLSYKENSADPSIWLFAFEILSIAACVLAFYYIAGFAFGRPRPLSTVYCCQIAAFLCIVTLADQRALSYHLIFGASAAMLLILSSVLIGNMSKGSSSGRV